MGASSSRLAVIVVTTLALACVDVVSSLAQTPPSGGQTAPTGGQSPSGTGQAPSTDGGSNPERNKERKRKKGKPPVKAKILRGPYLQQTTENSTYVVWQSDKPVGGEVDYGTVRTNEHKVLDSVKSTFHAVSIQGLASNTKYFYRVRIGATRTGAVRFVTAKPSGPLAFAFSVIGDYGTGSPDEYKNAALIGAEPIDFLITVGDNIYGNGYDAEYNRGLFSPFGKLMQRVPIWPSLGNHDYGNDQQLQRNDASAYYKNFALPDQPAQERYYSFKWGNAQFLSINTEGENYGPGSPQYQWIEATLAGSDACWKVPFFHAPPYSSRSSRVAVRTTLVPLFEKYNVKLVLAGHQHNYERTVPLRGGVQDSTGITYVVTGGGGAALHPFYAGTQPPETAIRGVFYHHLLISVNDKTMTIQAIGSDGSIDDQFDLSCATQAPQAR